MSRHLRRQQVLGEFQVTQLKNECRSRNAFDIRCETINGTVLVDVPFQLRTILVGLWVSTRCTLALKYTQLIALQFFKETKTKNLGSRVLMNTIYHTQYQVIEADFS